MICEVVSKCVHVTVEGVGGTGRVAPGLMSARRLSAAAETVSNRRWVGSGRVSSGVSRAPADWKLRVDESTKEDWVASRFPACYLIMERFHTQSQRT